MKDDSQAAVMQANFSGTAIRTHTRHTSHDPSGNQRAANVRNVESPPFIYATPPMCSSSKEAHIIQSKSITTPISSPRELPLTPRTDTPGDVIDPTLEREPLHIFSDDHSGTKTQVPVFFKSLDEESESLMPSSEETKTSLGNNLILPSEETMSTNEEYEEEKPSLDDDRIPPSEENQSLRDDLIPPSEETDTSLGEDYIPPSEETKPNQPKTNPAHDYLYQGPITLERYISRNPSVNTLDMNPPVFKPVTKHAHMNHKSRGLSHLKMGIHASNNSVPSWQFGLIDSGCSDNLISIKALQTLADFKDIVITPSQAKSIRTANNDQSQEIHGKIQLYVSLITEDDQRISFQMPFYVVSGLVYQIFLGQVFLTSPYKVMETHDALYFNFKPETVSNDRANLQVVKKTYKLSRPATNTKKMIIPPQSAMRIQTNFVHTDPLSDDSFYYFQTAQSFTAKYPSLHIPCQTCIPKINAPIDIMVLNTTDKAIHLKRKIKLGFIKTEIKNNAIVQPISDFVSQSPSFLPSHLTNNLNDAASLARNTIVPLDDTFLPECHAAYVSSIYEHDLTQEEKKERNDQYKQEGYFQKSVSEVLSDSNNIPSFDYSGAQQFVPKSDGELLKECDLSHLSKDQQNMTRNMLVRNIDAFQRHPLDIGNCKDIVAYAPLTEPNPPMLYAKYVPIPLKYKEPAQKLIDEYCKAGVLAQTTESCRFTSNIFIIPKKDQTFRLIFDGRILSKYCQALPLALGNFDEIFAELAGKEFVSKMDVSKAYDQISVTPETSRMLSFFGPDAKRYIYLRAGQGLKFSSFFLNQAMDTILFGMDDVKSYCDDVFLSSNTTFEEHLLLLEKVIRRFKKYNVKLNIAKLEVAPKQLEFLGLIWSKNKLSIPKSKITAYLNLKKPKSLKEARFLVNSTAFYRRFIPNFSEIISPVLDLLKEKTKKFIWTDVHQEAIDRLIKIIESGISLYIPRKDRQFIIQTDASYVAAAATVCQYDDNGEMRLVAAVSRSFIKSERNLAPVQKEILALIYTLASLHYILKGADIVVFADARSICLLKTCATSSPYLSRLAMELSQYNFELHHIEGRLNLEPDAFSRLTRTQDKILAMDKTHNNAMTREESLLFLEYLKIPTGYRYSVPEVRRMITSDPLRSQLMKRVKAKYLSNLKTDQDNKPTIMKSKKTHEPRYTRRHPLEKRNVRRHPLDNYSLHIPFPPPNIPGQPVASVSEDENSDSESDRYSTASEASNDSFASCASDVESDISEDEDFYLASNVSEDDNFYAKLRSLYTDPIDPDSGLTYVDNEEQGIIAALDLHCIYTCKDPTCILIHVDNDFKPDPSALIDSMHAVTVPDCKPISRPVCEIDVSNDNGQIDQPCHVVMTSALSPPYKNVLPECNAVASMYTLNNAVGIKNVELKESLADLALKSNVINSGILTPAEFADAQLLDPQITELREAFDPKRHKSLELKENILFRISKTGNVPYLPKSLETFLFNCMHFHILAGHRSAQAMITAIKEQFFVIDLTRKVKAFCKHCYICSIAKPLRMESTFQGITRQANYPKQIMSFDIFGALSDDPESTYKYVYSFMDNFSLFVINIKATSKTMVEILAAFLQVFAIWSQVPLIVCSDNETGLMTNDAADFFASFGISHNPGPSHAHWRLLSETASVKKSKDFMRSILFADSTKDWQSALDLGTIALNQTKTIHGYSPLQLFFGNSKSSNPILDESVVCTDAEEYDELIKSRYAILIEKVNAARKDSNTKRTALVNKYRKSKNFEVNQLVWLKALNITPNRAVKIKNKGPFKILEKINSHTFKLSTLANPNKCDRISHATHLEPYKNSVDITSINFPKLNLNPKKK